MSKRVVVIQGVVASAILASAGSVLTVDHGPPDSAPALVQQTNGTQHGGHPAGHTGPIDSR